MCSQDHFNIREVKARGAFVILLTKEGSVVDDNLADIRIRIPDVDDRSPYSQLP